MMEKEYNPIDIAQKWSQELKMAKREDEKWCKRGKKIVKRYRDERSGYADNTKKYNILWSNIQTLFPAMYIKTPRPEVERRHKDQDPVGRTASQILERALSYELENYQDFDHAMRAAIMDRLLPGRGIAWVRFENREITTVDCMVSNQAAAVVDTVFWEDFRCSPARTWDEVTWVARRVYMSKQDVVQRFGEEYADVPLTHVPLGLDEMIKNGEDCEHMKKAQIWEIWNKSRKEVCWVAENYPKALDCIDDPYGLDNFWPCPKPLYATQTTDTLVPIPDFALYQDQADEIDMLTQRINLLLKALRLVGVYDASQTGVQRMISEGTENTMIPVDTWAAFSEKGGIKGVVDFLPLEMVVNTLQSCYAARDQAKQVIYEITGLSDIIRGASVASETATAQQIKSQFASLRLKDIQRGVAIFASELLRIKAQMMADLYPPEQLVEMSGIMGTQDAQFVEPALQLLKSEPSRNFRIEVAADSLVEMDEQAEKASRMEFLQAAGGFLQQVLPVAQQSPEMTPLLAEMLLFGVRAFKGGRPMESAFDAAMAQLSAPKQPQQPQPDPEQIKMQGQMQLESQKMQMQQADMQMKGQLEQARMQNEQMVEQMRLQGQQSLEQFKAQNAMQIESMKQEAETMRDQFRAQLEAETRIIIAQMQNKPPVEVEVESPMSEPLTMLAEAIEKLGKPKRRVVERGEDGRAVGVIEVEIEPKEDD